eukprot:6810-Prorocentrum_minimum.AAC.1
MVTEAVSLLGLALRMPSPAVGNPNVTKCDQTCFDPRIAETKTLFHYTHYFTTLTISLHSHARFLHTSVLTRGEDAEAGAKVAEAGHAVGGGGGAHGEGAGGGARGYVARVHRLVAGGNRDKVPGERHGVHGGVGRAAEATAEGHAHLMRDMRHESKNEQK